MSDTALSEKRVYGRRRDRTTAYVASGLGLSRVELAGDQVGRFALARRGPATAVAGGDGKLLVATGEDVLVGTGDTFAPTDFGPAAAVALADGTPVAATPDGTVARLVGDDWEPVGGVDEPRRAGGDLLAAADGVYRVGEDLAFLGAVDARDVAAAGPYAATPDGLVAYDGEFHRVAGANCRLVAAEGDRAHAVCAGGLLARRNGAWQSRPLPVDDSLADLAHGEALYAVTREGTMLVNAAPELTPDGQGGWRSRALGVRDVTGLAVP